MTISISHGKYHSSIKSRLRSWMNITPLSMINGNYQDIIKQQNRELLIYIACVALLALLLVIALIYIYRQMKALSIAKKGLQEVNERLFSLNEELEEVNRHLRSTNLELSESNLIKEAYIARFFKTVLCICRPFASVQKAGKQETATRTSGRVAQNDTS